MKESKLIHIRESEKQNFEKLFNEVVGKLNEIISELNADGIQVNDVGQLDRILNTPMPVNIPKFQIELALQSKKLKSKGITFGKDDKIIGPDREFLNKYEASALKGTLDIQPEVFAALKAQKEIGWKMKSFIPDLVFFQDGKIEIDKDKFERHLVDKFHVFAKEGDHSEKELTIIAFIDALNAMNKAFAGKYDYMDLGSIWIGFDPIKGGYFYRPDLYDQVTHEKSLQL